MVSAPLQVRRALAALLMVLAIGLAAPAAEAAVRAQPAQGTPVYVLRGMWGIFSSGMDGLAEELNAAGVNAVSVAYDPWREYTASIVKAYRAHPYPVVLIGHSWGANTILLMAYALARENIPVALLVFYDITEPARIPANVRRVINYRSDTFTGADNKVIGGVGFTGTIDNVTRSDLNHVEIDKAEDLHRQTIAVIRKLLGEAAQR